MGAIGLDWWSIGVARGDAIAHANRLLKRRLNDRVFADAAELNLSSFAMYGVGWGRRIGDGYGDLWDEPWKRMPKDSDVLKVSRWSNRCGP